MQRSLFFALILVVWLGLDFNGLMMSVLGTYFFFGQEGTPFHLRRVFMACIESDIAQQLHDLLDDFPQLRLGSYPKIGEEDYLTLLTLESRDRAYVERAVDSLVARIPGEAVVRVE